jgi:cysteine desulfurase
MIYLDNAATTPPLPGVVFEDADFSAYASPLNDNETFFANPSSPHALGIQSERVMNKARQILADILFCKPNELTFTAGGTEANNIAILGYAAALSKAKKPLAIFAEPWAHPSVLAPIQYACEQDLNNTACFCRFFVNKIPEKGSVLVCLSHVNHETGDITDIARIAKEIKKRNPAAVVFVDGAQGFCKDIHAAYHAADMYTFSGHKFHAPAGVGGLVVRSHVKLVPLFYGGGQENSLRPGTENVAGIIRMAQTAEYISKRCEENHKHISLLKETLASIVNEIPDVTINTLNKLPDATTNSPTPYILNLSFPGTKGEVLVHMLSERGIYVSTGAACKSRKKDKSVLAAMGFPKEIAESALRFSFSILNTVEEINKTKVELIDCVNRLRKITKRS